MEETSFMKECHEGNARKEQNGVKKKYEVAFKIPTVSKRHRLLQVDNFFTILWNTVKLGIKELLNKEQTGFKELSTDYQLFYTINLQLNKGFLKEGIFANLGNAKTWH